MTEKQINELIAAICSIAHGGTYGPTGLEMLAMAIDGEGPGWGGLPSAIKEAGQIADAIREGSATSPAPSSMRSVALAYSSSVPAAAKSLDVIELRDVRGAAQQLLAELAELSTQTEDSCPKT